MATVSTVKSSPTAMTVTHLLSLASSATAGWQSAQVDDNPTYAALDYEIGITLPMANTAPANDKTIYVYAVGWYLDGSSAYHPSDIGTATLPTGSEGTATIGGTTVPMSTKLAAAIPYQTQDMVVQTTFNLSNVFGQFMPDAWSLVIVNYSGAAIAGSGVVVQWCTIKETVV